MPKSMIFEGATPGIKFALGENPKRAGNPTGQAINGQAQQGRYPATRMGVEDVIREAFNDAKIYKAEWDAYDAKKTGIPPRKDLKLEALKEVLEGKRYVHSHCYRADEILMLLRIADDYGFKIRTLQHVLEGYKVAKEIAAHGAGASTFSDWWSYKVEAFDAIPYNAAIMQKKGVLVSPQQRRRRTDAPPQQRSRQGRQVRRTQRNRSPGHGHAQPRQAARHR